MEKSLELTYEKFKTIISNKMQDIFGNIEESGEWEFKVNLSDKMCLKINTEDAWKQYVKTKDFKILLNFIQTQCDILMSLDSKEKSFNDIKEHLIPSIRSEEFLNRMMANDYVIKKDLGKDLKGVVLLDQKRYTQIINKELYPTLPEDDEVFAVAVENLKNRGWVKEIKIYEEQPFDLMVFQEKDYSSHYQFFIRELIDHKIGDCYIAFPTNKIALVMKLKSDDWRDWIKSLNYFSKTVRKTFLEEAYPLSDVVIKYENGKYEVL